MVSPKSRALELQGRGFAVLPLHSIDPNGCCSCGQEGCASPAKHPWLRHGLKEASADPADARVWWTRWPAAQRWSETTDAQAQANLREQAEILAEAGVDFILAEATGSTTQRQWVIEACAATGLPVWMGLRCRVETEGGPRLEGGNAKTSERVHQPALERLLSGPDPASPHRVDLVPAERAPVRDARHEELVDRLDVRAQTLAGACRETVDVNNIKAAPCLA